MLNFFAPQYEKEPIYLLADKWLSQSNTANVAPLLRYRQASYGDVSVCVESLFQKYRQRIHTAIYTHCLTSETYLSAQMRTPLGAANAY